MAYVTTDDPRVVAAVERIRALRQLTRETHVITTRTQNAILSALPGDVLAAVALELRKDSNRGNYSK